MHISWDHNAFSALQCRNFRLFLMGQGISLIGLWMQRLGMSWLVYRLTDSAFLLGVAELLSLAPILVLGLFAGAWLDRHDLQKTLLVTQALSMLQAVALAALAFTGVAAFWQIALLGLFLGIVNAVDMPCRQSSVSLMVDNVSQLKSAISMHSMLFNTSRLIGPSIAGLVIYFTSEGTCFVINAISYIPVLYVLTRIHFRPRTGSPKKQNPIQGAIEGLAYVQRTPVFRSIFFLLAFFSLLSACYSVLFPLFATDVLHGDSKMLGVLFGGVGFGAVLAALSVALIVRLRAIPYGAMLSVGLTAAGMAAFSFSSNPLLSVALAAVIGYGMVVTFISVNTLVQTVAEDDKRSRVISLYTICGSGLGPIGGLCGGGLADLIGAPVAMLSCAVGLALIVLLYSRSASKASENLEALLVARSEGEL